MWIDDLMTRLYLMLRAPRARDERGDVPGWVLITIMSVGLMLAIGAVAKEELGQMLQSSLNKVK